MHADLATRLNSIRQRVRQHALELFAQPRNGCGPTNYTELEQGKEESISNYADRLKGLLRAKVSLGTAIMLLRGDSDHHYFYDMCIGSGARINSL